jgi:hypothetical protein
MLRTSSSTCLAPTVIRMFLGNTCRFASTPDRFSSGSVGRIFVGCARREKHHPAPRQDPASAPERNILSKIPSPVNDCPKWDHLRMVPLSSRTIDKLHQLQLESVRLGPEDVAFAYDDGCRFGETWWRKGFCGTLDRAISQSVKQIVNDFSREFTHWGHRAVTSPLEFPCQE